YPAKVVRNDVLHDGQAQAGTAGRARAGRVDPVEPLEDPVLLDLGDAEPLVGHGDVDDRTRLVVGRGPRRDGDPRVLAAVGHRVVDEVGDRGRQLCGVPAHDETTLALDVDHDGRLLGREPLTVGGVA